MKVLVAGSAGFIGSALSLSLLDRGDIVIGVENHHDYYDSALREACPVRQLGHPNHTYIRMDLVDLGTVAEVFSSYKPLCIVNFEAQAGVRYLPDNPLDHIDSNRVGFSYVLEGSRNNDVEHLVYALFSSVYMQMLKCHSQAIITLAVLIMLMWCVSVNGIIEFE